MRSNRLRVQVLKLIEASAEGPLAIIALVVIVTLVVVGVPGIGR